MTVAESIKVGVAGVGYLGRHHARIYAGLKDVELVAVADTDFDTARGVAKEYKTGAFSDARELLGRVSAVSIAAPTVSHHQLGKMFLEAGVDILVEKPVTVSLAEADELIDLAEAKGRIFQVGHLERFNGAVRAMSDIIAGPLFIECNRLSPFPERSTDIDVVMDLMIHDIDIILSLVRSPVKLIKAAGVPVVSSSVDIANARIEFESGCVANVTSSRISMKKERKIRIFQPDTYISLDYQNQDLAVYRRLTDKRDDKGRPKIEGGKVKVTKQEPLLVELEAFLQSVRTRRSPLVTGREGREALRVVMEIKAEIEKGRQRWPAAS